MERIYKGNFSEIEKLVDENKIEGHPYEKLYNYIRMTNMETLRKNCIRRTLADITEQTRELLETSFEKNCGKEVNFEMQPYLIKPYAKVVRKYSNQIGQVKTFDKQAEFEEMVEKIYKDVMEKINESPKLVQENIDKLHKEIMDACYETLFGVKYKGIYLAEKLEEKDENGENIKIINKETVKELASRLTDKDFDSFMNLEDSEIKKFKLSKRILELSDEIDNSQNALYSHFLDTVQKKIKACEEIIKTQLNEKKNKHLFNNLKENNIIEFTKEGKMIINLNLERLAEINIKGDIFDFLNVRCRLKFVEDYLLDNIEKNYLQSINDGSRKIKNLEEYYKPITFESIEPVKIKLVLDKAHREYREKKADEYNDITTAYSNLSNISEMFKTSTIKDIEQDHDSNTIALRMPAPRGMISRRDALYIIKTMVTAEENKEELNKLLNNDIIAKLPSNEENYILNSTRNLVYEHVTEDEKQNVKKIGKRGE